jgi:hypothetical protein
MTEHENLTAALAAVQAALPKVRKADKADTGKYTYTYANLTDLSEALLPLLSEHGLAFVAIPHVGEHGFVMDWQLRHVKGEALEGSWPLPKDGGPQVQGSALSYARRYCLMAVSGVAPDDDDGAAAQKAATAPKAKPAAKPVASPKRLLMDRLVQEGVDPQVFADWLSSTYGVKRLDDLEDADRLKVVEGVTKGGLCAQLKEVA